MTAAEVIEEARDQHPGFEPERTPDRTVLRFLSSWQRRVFAKIASRAPDAVTSVVTTAMPLADFDAGIPLTAEILHLRGGTVTLEDEQERKLWIVPWESRYLPRVRPAAYLENSVVKLVGPIEAWEYVTSVAIQVVQLPSVLASEKEDLALPDVAREAAVAAVASFLGQRTADSAGEPPIPRDRLAAQADKAEASLIEALLFRPAETWFVHEV